MPTDPGPIFYQYRITVNGSQQPITNHLPGETWKNIAEASENRAVFATLERRLVTPNDGNNLYPGIALGDKYVSAWSILAEIES
jgi:hypothetical protein